MSTDHSQAAFVDGLISVAAHLEPELEEALAEHGLTRPSFQVLSALHAAPEHELSQRALMRSVRRTSGTMSVRLGRLEHAGLVAREAAPDNRRAVTVTLTERGRERVERARPAYEATAQRLAAGVEDAKAARAVVEQWLGFFEGDPDTVAPRLGIAVAPAAVAARMRRAVGLEPRPGVLVMRVKRDSAADRAGLSRGDLIAGAGGTDVRTIGDLHRAVKKAKGSLPLAVVRGAEERDLTVAL